MDGVVIVIDKDDLTVLIDVAELGRNVADSRASFVLLNDVHVVDAILGCIVKILGVDLLVHWHKDVLQLLCL